VMTSPSDWHLGITLFASDWRLWGDEIRAADVASGSS
jgi:hypothetical protein